MGKGESPSPFCFPQNKNDFPGDMSEIEELTNRALADIEAAKDLDTLESLRVGLLGKSGSITGQLKQLGALPPADRKAYLAAGVKAAMNDPELVAEYRKAGVYFDPALMNSTRIAEDLNRYAELERAFYQQTGRLK